MHSKVKHDLRLMEEILHQLIAPLFTRLYNYTSQVVQDFFHQQYLSRHDLKSTLTENLSVVRSMRRHGPPFPYLAGTPTARKQQHQQHMDHEIPGCSMKEFLI